ncbi:MAG: hypothetical protein ACFFED_13905 [Candidatus Thorarchaeota archaeon]
MKRSFVALLLVLLLPTPVLGVTFDPTTYVDDGVAVTVYIQANTPWSAPFNEIVNVSVGVAPLAAAILEVNITSIELIVASEEADGSDFLIIDSADRSGTPLATGTSYANYSTSLQLSGTSHGLDCYFAIMVSGNYGNGTYQDFFQALSPDTLAGPFIISASIQSPIVWVGLIILGVSGVIFVAGIYGVKKSRKRSRRRHLED